MQSVAATEMANSVITLLRGAGLLDNLTEIAEKRRIEDEYVLTEKLEMVKGMLICLTYLQPCMYIIIEGFPANKDHISF